MLFERISLRSRLRRFRSRPPPSVLAVFSFRFDAHLVPDLLRNIGPMVDGWVGFDDRQSDQPYSDEPLRKAALIGRARQLGASWVLAIDPDERLELGAADRIREMTGQCERILWQFQLRELFAPTSYRVDSVWGQKRQIRLFPLLDGQQFSTQALHGPWYPIEPGYRRLDSGLNLYHLKMITRARREARRDLYARLDPEGKFQRIGYDYLADDTGAEFEDIAPGRHYLPRHKEDHGLWMAEIGSP